MSGKKSRRRRAGTRAAGPRPAPPGGEAEPVTARGSEDGARIFTEGSDPEGLGREEELPPEEARQERDEPE